MALTSIVCKKFSCNIVGLDYYIPDSCAPDSFQSETVVLYVFDLKQLEKSSVNLVVREVWHIYFIVKLNQELESAHVLIDLIQLFKLVF